MPNQILVTAVAAGHARGMWGRARAALARTGSFDAGSGSFRAHT